MKKIILSLLVILSLVFITGCNDNKSLLKEKKLNNVTLTQSVDGELKYTIKKNGVEFVKNDLKNEYGYRDFGTQVYQYKTTSKTTTVDGEKKTVEYVSSTKVTDVDFSNLFDSLLSITKDDVTKAKNVYTFKELKKNELLIPFTTGEIYIDAKKLTKLESAYSTGMISLKDANMVIEKGYLKELNLIVEYSNKVTSVKYEFKDYKTTETNVLKEDASQYSYYSYLKEGNAYVTLKFKGIGTIKLAILENEETENIVNYFIKLFKNGKYSGSVIDSSSTTGIFFGNTLKKDGLNKSVTVPTKSPITNKKGTLSMVFKNSDSNFTQQLVLNLSDNTSYDSTVYVPVAGVVEGFEIIDQLVNMTSDELTGLDVKVKVEYNSYKYNKPELIKK